MNVPKHTHTQKKTRKRKRRPKRISNQSEFYNETSEYIQNVRLSESYGSFKHDRLHNRVFFSSSKLLCCFFCVRFALTDPVCGKVFNGHKKK